MSYDCCKLCGKLAKEQGRAMTEICEKEGCPGRMQKEFFDRLVEEHAPPNSSPLKGGSK